MMVYWTGCSRWSNTPELCTGCTTP